MTLGLAERQGRLGNVAAARCEAELPQRSVYRLLHAERDRLVPEELFADLDDLLRRLDEKEQLTNAA